MNMNTGFSETRVRSAPSHPIDAGGFAPGTIVAGRYRIVSLAGRGGMGEVYRADDLRLGQKAVGADSLDRGCFYLETFRTEAERTRAPPYRHVPVPPSLNDSPSIGTNCQE